MSSADANDASPGNPPGDVNIDPGEPGEVIPLEGEDIVMTVGE